MLRARSLALSTALLALTACGGSVSNPEPPRSEEVMAPPARNSGIAMPLSIPLSRLQARLNVSVPTRLFAIDKPRMACLPPQRVKLFGKRVKVLGTIRCDIVGEVTRGPISLTGKGERLRLTMPVSAVVMARNVGGIIKQETATAAAVMTADVRLTMGKDWQPQAKVDIDYRWTKEPGIDFLGQRIRFTDKADPALQRAITGIEAQIPRELAKLQPRDELEKVWAQGFTSVSLNRENPPVWLRITPKGLGYGGYSVIGGDLVLRLALAATTETFVGERPADPPATPLPPLVPIGNVNGLAFHLPVVADYAELEPVLEKALGKLSAKGLLVEPVGKVDVEFGKVRVHGTTGHRLAVGLDLKARSRFVDADGTVWLTGQPWNAPDSEQIVIRDLTVAGRDKDSKAFDLLLAVVNMPQVSAALSNALVQDFSRDYDKIIGKARRAIAEKRLGAFVLRAEVREVHHGRVVPFGAGLYLPVDAKGTATLDYRPLRPVTAQPPRTGRK